MEKGTEPGRCHALHIFYFDKRNYDFVKMNCYFDKTKYYFDKTNYDFVKANCYYDKTKYYFDKTKYYFDKTKYYFVKTYKRNTILLKRFSISFK